MRPPKNFELMLEGLLIDPASQHTLLGDLAEEWNHIVASAGVRRANRWYRMQALKAVIPLVGQWARQSGARSILMTLGVGFFMRVAAWVLGSASALIVIALASPENRWVGQAIWIISHAAWAFIGGVQFAGLYRNASLARALCLVIPFWFFNIVLISFTLNGHRLGDDAHLTQAIAAAAVLAGVFDTLRYRKRFAAATVG
jgi:hypothetical protein